MNLFTYGFYGAGNAGDDAILEAVSVRSKNSHYVLGYNRELENCSVWKGGNFSEHPYLSSNH
jgi:hypothetical protein